uniref:Uncharacterized protein n=1 Tax=Arundo donax TaxID=35708 RepID=A0A0A9B787_ARUDO
MKIGTSVSKCHHTALSVDPQLMFIY